MKPGDAKVLLTGATGGIGSGLAAILVERGARVLLSGRDEAKLQRLRDSLPRAGHAAGIAADIATDEGLHRVADAARQFHGGINVLINNAGVNRLGRFEDQSSGELGAMIDTNLVAPVFLTHLLIPTLRQQTEALIVNNGSILGSIGVPGQAVYSSTKFALHGFSEALRRELAGSSIKVTYVAPRTTDTAMNDELQREINASRGAAVDEPALVARQIADALFNGRRERFIGWPERLFVKINALLPGLVDRSVQRQAQLLEAAATSDTSTTLAHDGAKS